MHCSVSRESKPSLFWAGAEYSGVGWAGGPPAPPFHTIGCASAVFSPVISLHDILLAHRALQAQRAFRLQLSPDGDDLLLRRFHLLDLHCTHDIHVFLQHLAAA